MREQIELNDNELIYLMKNGSEYAYGMLLNKYSRFIHSRVYEMHLKDHDDCYQEGTVVLFNAAINFNDNYNKSFMKYFEKLLNHKLLDMKRIQERDSNILYSNYIELDNFRIVKEENILLKKDIPLDTSFISKLTGYERLIFEDYFLCNMSIKNISEKNNLDKKIIYYTIYRIKRKIKKYMVK